MLPSSGVRKWGLGVILTYAYICLDYVKGVGYVEWYCRDYLGDDYEQVTGIEEVFRVKDVMVYKPGQDRRVNPFPTAITSSRKGTSSRGRNTT